MKSQFTDEKTIGILKQAGPVRAQSLLARKRLIKSSCCGFRSRKQLCNATGLHLDGLNPFPEGAM